LNFPSIAGKTIGTSSYIYFVIRQASASGSALDMWGFQFEAGSVATPFTTATGTLQGELAACQRYYWRNTNSSTYAILAMGLARSTTDAQFNFQFPTSMRVAPTAIDYSTLIITNAALFNTTITTVAISQASSQSASVYVGGATGLTQAYPYFLGNNNSTSGYVGFSAEL
jgi:hypothetical protein